MVLEEMREQAVTFSLCRASRCTTGQHRVLNKPSWLYLRRLGQLFRAFACVLFCYYGQVRADARTPHTVARTTQPFVNPLQGSRFRAHSRPTAWSWWTECGLIGVQWDSLQLKAQHHPTRQYNQPFMALRTKTVHTCRRIIFARVGC